VRYRYDPAADAVVPVCGAARPAPSLSIRRDLPAYRSPVTGDWIEGRAARREDLARNDCREVDPSERPAGLPERRR
jgi:hypothetical protein